MIKASKISRGKSKFRFRGIFWNILRIFSEYSTESFWKFFGIFSNISRNLLEHSRDSFWTFFRILLNINWNLFEHSPESSGIFPRIFGQIPQNVKVIKFPGIFLEISRNAREHSLLSQYSPHFIPRFCISAFINSLK